MSSLITLLDYGQQMTRYPLKGSLAYRFCNTTRELCGCEHHFRSHRLNDHLNWWSIDLMARKGQKNGSQPFTPVSFVQCQLDAEEKKKFATWQAKNHDMLDTMVIEILQANHKISFSYSDNSDSFIVSVTGKPEDCINASRCYTSHAKDYATGLWVACFKFHVLWNKGVWEDVDTASDFG